MCVLRVETLVLTAPSGIAQWKFENFCLPFARDPSLSSPGCSLAPMSSLALMVSLPWHSFALVMLWLSFHPFCLCLSCLGIFSLMFLCLLYWLEILQLCYSFFFFLLSACLVLPLPFVPAHFPCMVLWSFIFLHVGFLLHQALISHYCTIGQKKFF